MPRYFQPGNVYGKTHGFQPGHPDFGTQFRPGPDPRRGRFSEGHDPNRSAPLMASDNPSWKGRDIGYTAAHYRVRACRGKASAHPCVDCGKGARHWSYNGRDPQPLVEVRDGIMLRYSPDIAFYEPRCQPCHVAFDRRRDDQEEHDGGGSS